MHYHVRLNPGLNRQVVENTSRRGFVAGWWYEHEHVLKCSAEPACLVKWDQSSQSLGRPLNVHLQVRGVYLNAKGMISLCFI